MKALVGIVVLIALIGGGWYLSTQSAPQAPVPENGSETTQTENAERPVPGVYTLDSEQSLITWEGQKPLIAGYAHRGTIGLTEGAIIVTENDAEGSFVIDMNTIEVTSLGGGKVGQESQLEAHLKAADFFDVEEHPTATFVLSAIIPAEGENSYTVSGTLTMKGTTEEIEFPATIYADESGMVHAEGSVQIDRTRWGITFASGSVFNNLAENAISDTIVLTLNLVLTKNS